MVYIKLINADAIDGMQSFEDDMMDEIIDESAKANQAYVDMIGAVDDEEEVEETDEQENHQGYYG